MTETILTTWPDTDDDGNATGRWIIGEGEAALAITIEGENEYETAEKLALLSGSNLFAAVRTIANFKVDGDLTANGEYEMDIDEAFKTTSDAIHLCRDAIDGLPSPVYTVVAEYEDNGQTFVDTFEADTPQAAADACRQSMATFCEIKAVFPGNHKDVWPGV